MSSFVISIVSHQQNQLVNKLLVSLDKHLLNQNYDLTVLITQNKTDGIPIYETNQFKVKLKYNLQERGFGENHNHIYEQYKPDFFAVMNPDIKVNSVFNVDEICNILLREPGIYSPCIVEKNGEVADFRRKDLTPINLLKRILFRKSEDDQFDWLAGMSLFMTGEVFKTLNGFDERFFMYVEDCDICMRARSMGFSVGLFDGVQLIHDARRASHKNIKALKLHLTSLFKYWLKSGKTGKIKAK